MYGVELYAAVRLAVVDEGLSHHEAGRRFGIDRRTVKKMLSYSAPPGYRRTKPVRRPKLDGFTGIIDAILEADRDLPERYGPYTTCYNRFNRWRKKGIWDRLMDAIVEAYDGNIQMIDSSSVRVHQHAAGSKKGVRIVAWVVPEAD